MFGRMIKASILHNRRRLAVTLAAVVVPAALVTAFGNFVLDARAKMATELRQRGPNLVILGSVPEVPGVAAGRVESVSALPDGAEVPVVAIDAEPARRLYPGWRVDGAWLRDGCMVGARLAERLRLKPGDRLLDRAVEGIVETGEAEDDVVFVPRRPDQAAQRIDASIPGGVEEVEAVARSIEERHPGVEARVQRQIAASEGAILGKLTLAFTLVAVLVGAVSALSMAMSLAASVAQRRAEFAILRSLGAGDGGIVRLLAAETAIVLAIGLAVGAGAGLGLSQWLGLAVFGQGVAVRPLAIAGAALACALLTAAAAVVPARRALAVDPARVLKEE